MSREIAVLLFLVSTMPNSAIGFEEVSPTQQVQCYSGMSTSSSSTCSGISIGNMAAKDCCSGNGSTFTFSNQCLGCVLVGFTVTELKFTSDNASTTAMVELEVEKAIGTFSELVLDVNSVNFTKDPSSDINDFVEDYPERKTFTIISGANQLFTFMLTSGNLQALEKSLEFFIEASLSSTMTPSGDVGLIISQPTVKITVADLDELAFSIDTEERNEFAEGSAGGVVVFRNNIQLSRDISVFVTARRLFNVNLLPNEFLADDTDFENKTKNYTFTASGNKLREQKEFFSVEDNIVEQGKEVFEVVLTSDDPSVKILPGGNVQRLFIQDDDVFQIGFLREEIVVTEGDDVSVTIVQTNDVTGQRRASDVLEKPSILNKPFTADDEGIDYNYTLKAEDVPNMMINATSQLDPITIKIGSTESDNILEGREYFRLQIGGLTHLQIDAKTFRSRIYIRDATAAEVKLKQPVYYTDESSSSLLVCAEIIAKSDTGLTVDLEEPLTVSANLMENTAKSGADYTNNKLEFTFRDQSETACSRVSITQDTIREEQENFTITLNPLSEDTASSFTNVSVNEDPSYIVISDDDGADVYFDQDFATFSEADGDQDIYLRYSGAQPVGNITVEVYDIDTGVEVGQVTFTTSSGNQRVSFSLSNPDNNLALEPNRIFNLGINKSQSFDIGTPSNMTIMIVDDDVVAVDFEFGSYSFSEGASLSSGISLMLSTHIAQSLTVRIVGGPGAGQPSSVVVSGSAVDSTVTFPAGQTPLMLPVFTINDDNTGLETDEKFQLEFLSSSPSGNVILGDPANITITDDDIATITFSNAEYTFLENAGVTRQVTVELNREVAREFTVRVNGNTLPLAPGVVDSGSSVNNKPITFTAYNSSKSNLQQIVELRIVNDSVSGEPDQRYTLTLSQQPSDVAVSPSNTTTIIIVDDDNSGVRFEPFVGPLFESAQMYDLTVFLNGEISHSVSVDVLDTDGNFVSTVEFQPISGQTTQSKVVTVTFADDENALEDTEILTFSLSNPNGVTVTSPSTIDVLVTDDDNVTVTFVSSSYNYTEDHGVVSDIQVQLSNPIANDLTVMITGGPGSQQPSTVITSGTQYSSSVMFPANSNASSPLSISSFSITNDENCLETDEVYQLMFSVTPGTSNVNLGQPTTIRIADEDNVTVTFSSINNTFYENELNPEIGVQIDKTILQDLEVSVFGEPPSGVAVSGQLVNTTVTFKAQDVMQTTFFIGITNDDIAGENDENYKLKLVKSSPSEGVILGPDATVTIIDVVVTRTCQYNSTTQNISTFGGFNTYQYNQTCEHALLKQMTTIGELGVYIDSLDGTFMTTRVGVRIGLYESIVVGAYTRTVIRQNSLSHIAFTITSTKLSITVSSLSFAVEITDSGISVIIAFSSKLQEHMGLCGDLNGKFTFWNVDPSNMTSLNRMISRFLTPPSETFIRKRRPECGLVGEDLQTGDPLFVVPLYTPSAAKPHSYSLCYEIHGYGNETYNFISDECTQVSAHYYETTDPDPKITRAFHGVDEIHITAVNNRQQCVSITVSLKNKVHSTSVGDSLLVGKYLQSGISVRQIANNRTRISVPNCADNRLIMNVISRNLDTTIPFLDFKVVRGLNLRESSHGLIGQFWNVKTSVTKYTKPLRDSIVYNDTYLIEIMPRNKPKRRFIGFLYEKTWNFGEFPCLYVGNAEGGPIGEVADGEPNDSLIEGSMNKYSTSNFAYDQFDEDTCKIVNIN